MSLDEIDAAGDEYDSELAQRTLEEEGLNYVLQEKPEEIRKVAKDWRAEDWLEQSHDWLRLLNVVSQHDREQIRESIWQGANHGRHQQATAIQDLQLFKLASSVSDLLESLAKLRLRANDAVGSDELTQRLDLYAQSCLEGEDLTWASDLVAVTRAFREVLFAIADPQRKQSLEWTLSDHIKTIDAALQKGTLPRLVSGALQDKRRKFFVREPNPTATPLPSLLADWISDYLVNYSDRIDLGTCVECGKVFSRQRRDNTYCSKTCQNRVAYKRKKIFETGLLEKLEITQKSTTEELQRRVWVYHPRLGLGLLEMATEQYKRLSSITVRFPQTVRVFSLRDLFQPEPDTSKIEFYRATDVAALAELL